MWRNNLGFTTAKVTVTVTTQDTVTTMATGQVNITTPTRDPYTRPITHPFTITGLLLTDGAVATATTLGAFTGS